MLSTYLQSFPLQKVNRWSKVSQSRIDVEQPNVVSEYNKHMGGVDLDDMLLALYRIDRRSKKYYNRIIYYLFGVCTINAWTLFKINNSTKISLLDFTLELSFSLMRSGKPITALPAIIPYRSNMPSEDSLFDNIDHMPLISEKPQRCKVCSLKTHIYCRKCNNHICIIPDKSERNCFLAYHTNV